MSMLVMLKEGGTLVIEAKGNTMLDEDLDFALNESGSGGFNYSLRWMLWSNHNKLQYGINADELLLVGV